MPSSNRVRASTSEIAFSAVSSICDAKTQTQHASGTRGRALAADHVDVDVDVDADDDVAAASEKPSPQQATRLDRLNKTHSSSGISNNNINHNKPQDSTK